MAQVLHVLSSYPDPIAPDTVASSLLLELTAKQVGHHVYTFKRAGWRAGQCVVKFDDAAGTDHRAIVYGALPKGLNLVRSYRAIADYIIADAGEKNLRPDVVHAHKASMDGFVGARVAQHFQVPLCLTVQANTDVKIIRARRDLRNHFRSIWQNAAHIFPFTPVAQTAMEGVLGPTGAPVTVLPCPTKADQITAPVIRAEGAAPIIRTAFNIAHYENKNIETLLKAVQIAAQQVPDIQLEIIGGGDAEAFLTVARMAETLAPGRAVMLGAKPQAHMQGLFNQATGFALMSRRESYGMVYAESLLAGTPCLYSKDRAIDGLFPEGAFTLSAEPDSAEDTAKALVRLCNEEADFKTRLKTAQEDGTLNILRQDDIVQKYLAAMSDVVTKPAYQGS